MNDIVRFNQDISRCLVCHDAPCSKACPAGDPARLIRALRFDNTAFAVMNPHPAQMCGECDIPCEAVCPQNIPIRNIISTLKNMRTGETEVSGWEDVDLSVDICGVKAENPFFLSSSVVASSYEMCANAFEMGWAGASFKTICLMDIHETSPRFSAMKNKDGSFYGFKNIEQLSPHSLEEDMQIIRRLKENYPEKIIIASIMGRNEQEWTHLAQMVTKAGADVIECNFSCPNMEEKGVGVDIGQDPEAVGRFTAAVRRGTHIPVLAKLTPNVTDIIPAARAAADAGADGIAAINTVKSIANINPDTLASAPSVRGFSSIGGYSGAAVKPIALRFISDIASDEETGKLHISGMGGIETWKDAMEFILLGSSSLQVTTAVMQYGYRIIDDLISGLKIYMAQRGYKSVGEMTGKGNDQVVDAEYLERDSIIYPSFIRDRCVGCGRCYISCRDGGHSAISFDSEKRRPVVDARKCVGCHLCVLVCPKDAISGLGKRRQP